jgi:mannose-6-phosphate isomerase-like protein (cupin superfamily)
VRIHALVLALAALLRAGAAHAATFTANTTLDLPDASAGDGLCLTVDMSCSLRAAVQQANASAGADTILLQDPGPYELRRQEPDAADPDEDAAATGDLDVAPGGLTIEVPASASPRAIEVRLDELAGDPPEDRIFQVLAGASLTLRDLVLRDGVATSASTFLGGAILNQGVLALERCLFEANDANAGGAVFNSGTLDVDACTFTNNDAVAAGVTNADGGAIYSSANALSTTVEDSTFGANSAQREGGAFRADQTPSVVIRNSTFSGNLGPDVLRFQNVPDATLLHVTVHDNQGVGISAFSFGGLDLLEITNTIVSGQTGANCAFSNLAPQRLASLSDDASCGFAPGGGLDAADPELGPLAPNGGPTETHLPAPTSPAVDQADLAECLARDQRGVLRPDGTGGEGECDMGSVELLPEPAAALLGGAALAGVAVASRRRGAWRSSAALLAALGGCLGAPTRAEPPAVLDALIGDRRVHETLGELVRRDPLPPGESFEVVELGRDAHASHHLIWIRDRELPHRHDRHDLLVVLLRGHGSMRLGADERAVGQGSVLYVPRGSVHAFRNQAAEPAAAYAVYFPAFDGTDRQPAE